jgi:exoribonuclease R
MLDGVLGRWRQTKIILSYGTSVRDHPRLPKTVINTTKAGGEKEGSHIPCTLPLWPKFSTSNLPNRTVKEIITFKRDFQVQVKSKLLPGVVAHAFNPSPWEAEANRFLSSRPAWCTE